MTGSRRPTSDSVVPGSPHKRSVRRHYANSSYCQGNAMTSIPIDSLYQPHLETQGANLDQSRVQYYMCHQSEISDILVYKNPVNGELVLVNGHHRVASARRLKWSNIEAVIEPGTRHDALMYRDLDRIPWSEINDRSTIDCQPGSPGTICK